MTVIPICVEELVPHTCDCNIMSDKALYGMHIICLEPLIISIWSFLAFFLPTLLSHLHSETLMSLPSSVDSALNLFSLSVLKEM